jgi:hypothetical protein
VAVETIPNTKLSYFLIPYDSDGKEGPDEAGLLSERVLEAVKQGDVSDVLLLSHGWKGDLPAAQDQYNRWIAAAARCVPDLEQLRARSGGFKPLIVGLHWPSLPFGDEEFQRAASYSGPPVAPLSDDKLIQQYLARLADTPTTRHALETIFAVARQPAPAPAKLPAELRDAYEKLDQEVNLASKGPCAAPGTDHPPFNADLIYAEATTTGAMSFGLLSRLRDAVLSPLRQLSFWKMKDRARRVGEAGIHNFVRALLLANEDVKLHLMGHSFGCIVVSSAVAGPTGGSALPRPVQSLMLVQGALSLWSYCSSIPSQPGTAGYFSSIVGEKRVAGAIVTTRSRLDRAVGWWYPLGARAAGQVVFAPGGSIPENLPTYGAVGCYGLQGQGISLINGPVVPADGPYDLRHGYVYNLDGSRFIFRGGGASGAHSDIDNPEVGHAFWAAILAQPGTAPVTTARGVSMPAPPASRTSPLIAQSGEASGDLEQLVRLARGAAKELGTRIRIEIEIEPYE